MALRAGVYPNPIQDRDFANYLARNNPYAPMTPLTNSPNTGVAKTYADLAAGQDWITAQRNNARAAVNGQGIYSPGMGWNPAGGKASPWQAPPIAPGQSAPAVAGSEPNPFSVVSNPKNTQITSLLDKVLAQASNSLTPDMNKNPYSLYSNEKDAQQGQAIAGARDRFGNATAQTQQQLADFTKDYLAGNTQARDFAAQETGSLGGYYNGGVQNDLNRLAREREMAVARSTERALDRARGSLNQQRFMSGDSSRLQSQYLNTLTDVLANEARQQADLNRANYLTVRSGADANAGRRQQILDNSLSRGLVPLNASYAQSAAELSQLGALGNLTGQNNVYNMDTPESRMARQLGVLGQASNLDQQNTFYTLRRPYEPDFSGYSYNTPRGVTGGGYYVGGGTPEGYYEPDFSGQLNPQAPAPRRPMQRQAAPAPYYQPGGSPSYLGPQNLPIVPQQDWANQPLWPGEAQVPYAPYSPAARSGWDYNPELEDFLQYGY